MKIKKKCQICTHAVWFYFILLVCAQFCNVIEKSQLFKSLKTVNNLWPMKNVRFEYIPWKKCLVLFHFHSLGSLLVIKLRKFDFEKHWDTSIFFDKKKYNIIFEYAPYKNDWFCYIFTVWVHFNHKTEKFRFWKILKYFWWKNDVSFECGLSNSVDFV